MSEWVGRWIGRSCASSKPEPRHGRFVTTAKKGTVPGRVERKREADAMPLDIDFQHLHGDGGDGPVKKQ